MKFFFFYFSSESRDESDGVMVNGRGDVVMKIDDWWMIFVMCSDLLGVWWWIRLICN